MIAPAEPFEPFGKIPRLRRGCFITEKIDGTNGCVYITYGGTVHAASRKRWITPENDNAGFAAWVEAHRDELAELGPGRHFGEWWGAGIQRRYGVDTKRFSLFNTGRWSSERPACTGVVPVLYAGVFSDEAVATTLATLRDGGSVAAPGFMDPEGIVVYLTASGQHYKVTLAGDGVPKGAAA